MEVKTEGYSAYEIGHGFFLMRSIGKICSKDAEIVGDTRGSA